MQPTPTDVRTASEQAAACCPARPGFQKCDMQDVHPSGVVKQRILHFEKECISHGIMAVSLVFLPCFSGSLVDPQICSDLNKIFFFIHSNIVQWDKHVAVNPQVLFLKSDPP